VHVLVLWQSRVISKTLTDELYEFIVVLDTVGDNKAFAGGDVVHDELLETAGIKVSDVLNTAVARHTKRIIAKSSAEEVLHLVCAGVMLQHMVVEVMCFRILRSGDVSSHHTARLKGDINHHLEHVSNIVFDAAALEESAFLIVVHVHFTTAHLDHSIVDRFVGVLERFEVGVFQGKKGT